MKWVIYSLSIYYRRRNKNKEIRNFSWDAVEIPSSLMKIFVLTILLEK